MKVILPMLKSMKSVCLSVGRLGHRNLDVVVEVMVLELKLELAIV